VKSVKLANKQRVQGFLNDMIAQSTSGLRDARNFTQVYVWEFDDKIMDKSRDERKKQS
jgi:hypothetical protein